MARHARHRTGAPDEALRRYHETGDRRLRNRIVEQQRWLADQLANAFANRGIERDDLQQVALLALTRAVERYDPDKGSSFAAFARSTIRGEIKRHFRDHVWSVRPPRRVQELHLEVRRATEELTHTKGRPPTVAEVADLTELHPDEVLVAMAASNAFSATPLDEPGSGAADAVPTAPQLGTDDRSYADVELQVSVARAVEQLADRERIVLELRFWEERSQSDIAGRLGMSQMQVSRMLRRTMRRLSEDPALPTGS